MHQDRRRAWARAVLVLVALLALLVVLAPAAMAQPTDPAQPQQPDPGQERCDTIPNPVARSVCQLGTNPGRAVTNTVTGAAQNVVQTAGDSALRSFTAAVASAGQFFLERIGSLVTTTTSPDVVSADWFTSQYRVMLALAVVIALPILLVSVAQSIVRADGMQAIRSAFVYLPIAAILSAVGPAMAQILIEVSDWMSAALSNNASADAQKFMADAGSSLAALGAGTLNPAAPVFGVLLGALIVVLGALSIWLELLLRAAAIYISVLFLPLALAAMIWPAGWKWCRRLIEFLIAIIFAKVFIVAIVNLAAAGLARGGLGDKFEGVLAGGALLLMAAFTPIALLKLIPLAEAAVVTAGHQRAALRQATAGATALTTSSSVVSSMIQTRFRSGAATAAAPAAGWAAPAAAAVGAVSAARNRATSSFAAMSSVGGDVGGDSAPPASGRSAPRPSPVNAGGNAGGGAAPTRPLKLPDLERTPDA
jgi:enamine deaminase RidA (YjgF/YER057c/UK114 family)